MQGFFQIVIHNEMLAKTLLCDLFLGIDQTQCNGLRIISAPCAEPLFQHLHGRRHDKNSNRLGKALGHLTGSLHVNIQQDVTTCIQGSIDPLG